MTDFAVIGIAQDTGQIIIDKVRAKNVWHSYWVASQARAEWCCHIDWVFSIPWQAFYRLQKQGLCECPGESAVDDQTILSQPEVFNIKVNNKCSQTKRRLKK